MRIFFLKTFILASVFVGVIFLFDRIIQKGAKKLSYKDIGKWNEVINGGIDAEILIVGSSRALVHFDPRIMEKKTGKKCYNLGVDGNKYEVQKKILELYLKYNKKPEILYWSLDLSTFQKTNGVYAYEQFIPYWSEPEIKDIFKLKKDMNLFFFNFPTARYNSHKRLIYRAVLNNFPFFEEDYILKNGYRESNVDWDGRFDVFSKQNSMGIYEVLNDSLFNDFKKFSIVLKNNNIDVKWLVSPYFENALTLILNSKDIIYQYNKSAVESDIEFRDYSNLPISKNKIFFYNGTHMNKKGVNEFLNRYMEFN